MATKTRRGGSRFNPLHTGAGRKDGDGIGGTGFRAGGRGGGRGGRGGGRFGGDGARLGKKTEEASGRKDVKRGFSALSKKEFVEVVKRTKEEADEQDAEFGFEDFTEGTDRLGWMVTYAPVTITDPETGAEVSGVDYYFIQQDGSKFKVLFKHNPYFYIAAEEELEREVESVLRRKYADVLADVVHKDMWDLDLPNHLAGNKRKLLQLKFRNVKDLIEVRKELQEMVQRNVEKKKEKAGNHASEDAAPALTNRLQESVLDHIVDIREYDVPYIMRVAIDNEFFAGLWYSVSISEGEVTITQRPDLTAAWGRAEPRVLAFDIECTKEPLKFPDANVDSIYMISYMVDGEGYLIVNREIVSEDIEDFEYTPKKEFEGPFTCINVENELQLLRTWLDHVRELKPQVFVTYNGDFFDWPFIDNRMKKYGLMMEAEIGVQKQQSEEYSSRFACHLDAFHWVNRDSYLPQGSRGLKAVTKHKLGYDPKEISPEDMLPFARERPQEMASYSVSDAVATYYLYMQYVHPFIFSLCNIIPMTPGDVLRKGSGTLCETLLQVQAFRGAIVCPNKNKDDPLKMYKGHLIESETYIGGHVEALNSGVFRADFRYKFNVDPDAIDELVANLDRDLHFAIETEGGKKLEDVEDYEEQKVKIVEQLMEFKTTPRREEPPNIYHLDVAAMYPNIILTNRLQPPAMVTPQTCASCDFYHPEMQCRREMDWQWRGELFPASKSEIAQVEGQLKHNSDNFEASATDIRKRVKDYSMKVYKRSHDTLTEQRTAYICQRENSFYIDTVKSFRDRRYEYKGLTKKWGGKLKDAEKSGDPAATKECKNFVVLYDSLQLAHKCILNSFYGYVMRRGARWYSMEMAGVVTHKGGHIIRVARQLVERIGIPLELDTDGIWCCLPRSFPDGIEFKMKGEKKPFVVSYPCSMLNAQTHHDCENPQYHTLVNEEKQEYTVHKECSILFELDGPYKAMILPAAKEEGKRLKKRYAVFNFDGSLAELKGFELKRRGELQLVKVFQSEIFKRFLDGESLEECYRSVATVANQWLDVLDNKGVDLEDDELIDLISESTNMSRNMEEYEGRKSMAITTATRIAEFLGADMIKDKGLNCTYVVSRTPEGTPVTERAVPVEIFKAEAHVQTGFLKKWCHTSSLVDSSVDIRSILDWQYYKDRLASAIQKIVTIPAAMQLVPNPVERVPHPEWLLKIVRERADPFKQNKIDAFFKKADQPGALGSAQNQGAAAGAGELVDIEGTSTRSAPPVASVVRHMGAGKRGKVRPAEELEDEKPVELEPGSKVVSLVPTTVAVGTTMYTDFEKWLAHMRQRWRAQLRERKRKRAEDGDLDGGMSKLRRSAAGKGVAGFFQSRHYSMLHRHWEILQVMETNGAGQFNVWAVLEDGSMHKITMEVPRIFYVNTRFRFQDTAASLKSGLARKLPFGKTCYNLQEMVMSEEQYQQHSREIATEHEDPTVEGLYETQVPLLFRAIMDMGCVATVNRRQDGFRQRVVHARERPETISLLDMRFENTTACPYLPASKIRVRKAYLYHSFSESDGGVRGVMALLCPLDEMKCTVWVINRYANAQKPPLGRFLKEACEEQAAQMEEDSPERERLEAMAAQGVEFSVELVGSQQEAWAGVSEHLKRFQDSNQNAPMVLLKQSTRSTEEIARVMPMLQEFPVVEVPAYSEENEYEPLGWESKAGRSLVKNLVAIDDFYEYVLKYARYAHIPLCNISSNTADMSTTVSDVLFARLLKNNNYILWASPGQRPDVGSSDTLYAFECDEITNPDAAFPAAARQYCVSMDIQHLPLAAIVHAKELDDAGASAGNGGQDEFAELLSRRAATGSIPLPCTLVDETTFCLEPFKIIAYMCESWVKDAMHNANAHADALQMKVYQWINNAGSLFHSAAMSRFVHRLLRKAYAALAGTLRSLGADVLQASLHTLVLNTKKTQYDQAKAYCDFLSSQLKQVKALEYVQLVPTQFWARLIFMDRYNYAGLQELDADSEELEQAKAVQSVLRPEHDLSSVGLVLVCEFEIAEHLPKRFRRLLHELVGDYLCLPMRYRLERVEEAGMDAGPAATDVLLSPGLTQKRRVQSEVVKSEISFTRELFTSSEEGTVTTALSDDGTPFFTRRLFDEISKNSAADFPQRPGTHLQLGSPQLEFVKQLCHIFALDQDIKPHVTTMKRGLLKLLQVREFSAAAKFENPSRSVVLPDVFCSSALCSAARDVDLCRERDWVEGVRRSAEGVQVDLRCHACDLPYDKDELEGRLVQSVRQLVMSYSQQDLRCNKCRRSAAGMLTLHCPCSGTFQHATPPDAVMQRLRALEGVANFYHFEWLAEELASHLPEPEPEEGPGVEEVEPASVTV